MNSLKTLKNSVCSWLVPQLIDSPTSPNYSYNDTVDYYWPALIAGVEYYTGQNQIDYVGHSNGCRVALSSLEQYQETGKNNVAKVQDLQTGQYITVNLQGSVSTPIVNTFVGVGCPGAFEGESEFINKVQENGPAVINFFENNNIKHVTTRDVSIQFGLPFLVNIFIDDQTKISRDLLKFYFDITADVQDVNPGNVTINKLVMMGGIDSPFEVFPFDDGDDDGIVPINDINGISNKINSLIKVLNIFSESHNRLVDDNSVKNTIKEELS